jgi:hypothetical protein
MVMTHEKFEQLVKRNLSQEEAKIWLKMFDESRQHRLSVMKEVRKRWNKKRPEAIRAMKKEYYLKIRQDPIRYKKYLDYRRAYDKQRYWKDVDKFRSKSRRRYWKRKMKNVPKPQQILNRKLKNKRIKIS